ncbi:MAG: tetratricopeptide repeat protein [Halobacteriota archaeon]
MGSVDDNISQATDLLNKHDIEGAIQMYQEALKLDPDDPTALTGLGAAFDEAGELENSVDCYKKALKVDPDNVIAHTGLGVAYEKQGNTDLTIREFHSAYLLDEETASLHIAYARDRHEKRLKMEKARYESKVGELDEGIRRYQRTVKLVDRSISKDAPN